MVEMTGDHGHVIYDKNDMSVTQEAFDKMEADLAEAEALLRKIRDELWDGDHRGMIDAWLARRSET